MTKKGVVSMYFLIYFPSNNKTKYVISGYIYSFGAVILSLSKQQSQ